MTEILSRLHLRTLLLGTLLVTSAAGSVPAFAEALAPRIDAVEIRIDEDLDRQLDLASLVAFAPGERLTEAAVRRTLSNFHATGLVSEAEVLVRRDGGRTLAVVVLYAHTWVDSVEILGELALRGELLQQHLEQKAGAPLVESRLLSSVYALQDLYEERGYLEASVRLEVAPSGSAKRRRVRFHLQSGPRARLGVVGFTGEMGPFGGAELRQLLPLKDGTAYTGRKAASSAERLRAALVERGYLRAQVEGPRSAYDPETNLVELVYEVDVGPEIRVEVLGGNERWLRKKGLLPFLDEQGYDAALLAQSREKLRAHFQRKGYYRVHVDTPENEVSEGVLDLKVDIDPGPLYKLREIRFRGNDTFPATELRQLMTTADRQSFQPGTGRLVDEVLREDILNLRSFYVLQGFSEVEVGPVQIVTQNTDLVLVMPIHEGPRRRVVNLTLPGVERLDVEQVRRQLPLQPAGPFHAVLLEDSVNLLRALYEEEGYPETLVAASLDWNEEGTLVDVDLAVQEGHHAVVDRVILRGHQKTRPEVLHRFADLKSGDAISRRRLLETERDLYRLGVFSRVDVEVAPPSDASGRRDVLIRLDEGRRWRLGYGLSYHSDDGVGGLLSLSRLNLGGRGDRLQLDLRANSRNRRARLIFDQPSLGRFNVPITYTLFRQDEERESFTVQDLGLQVALTKDLPSVRLGLSYEYREVDLLETKVDPEDIEREDREVQISSITPNLFVDRRDDPLDPTRGFTASMQLEYAFPVIQATASFAKLFLQHSYYLGLGRFGVLASSLRLGAIEPLDEDGERDPLVPPELASSLVPVSERFFAGGRTTHRAYERDKLGVPDETLLTIDDEIFESGGNGLVLMNLEYRFPLAGAFGGSLFFDLGNVWADWRSFDADELKPGAGIGFRYTSPIGPVRLEVGWKLDPEPWEDENPVFFLSLGNPF